MSMTKREARVFGSLYERWRARNKRLSVSDLELHILLEALDGRIFGDRLAVMDLRERLVEKRYGRRGKGTS